MLDYHPDAPVTLVELARLDLVQGRMAEAIGYLKRALEIAPESDAVRRDLEALREGAPAGGR